jgi:hypothetical protein
VKIDLGMTDHVYQNGAMSNVHALSHLRKLRKI